MRPAIRNEKSGFTLVELLVVIAIIGALVGLLLPAVQAARDSARQTTCKNHLRQQALALLDYHNARSMFPLGVAGSIKGIYDDDGYGWAVALLPYLEQQALYDLIAPDWEPGPFARALRATGERIPGWDTGIAIFRCPSSELPALSQYGGGFGGYATSDYKACTGNGDSGLFFKVEDGFEQGYSSVRIKDVTDGLSKTIALGESSYFGEHQDWPIWMGAPNTDEPVQFKTQLPSVINCGVVPKALDRFHYAGVLDDDCAFSWHNRGAFFAFADGSVHWLDESIDFKTYEHLGTKNDGKVISDFK